MKRSRTEGGASPGNRPPSRRWLLLPAAAAVLFLGLALHAARVETPTVDEFAYVPAGCAYWRFGDTGFFPTNPPLVKYLLAAPVMAFAAPVVPAVTEPPLDWGPWLYGTAFEKANPARYLGYFFLARSVVVGFALLTGLLVFLWTRSLFGLRAAAIATALFFLCPNVLAHGHLATIDVACMLTIFLTLYLLDWTYRRPSLARAAVTGAALGLAFAVKFIALLVPPIVIAVAATQRLSDTDRPLGARLRSLATELAVLFLAAVVVLNAASGFDGSFATLGSFELKSESGRLLTAALPGWLPVPAPRVYVEGFDVVKRLAERSEFGSYLLGEWRQHGWWYYNLVAFFVKMPLLVLALMAWAVARIRAVGIDRTRLVGLLLPPLALFVLFATGSKLNIGLRHVLAAFPFLFVAIGALFVDARWRALPRRTLTAAVASLAIGALVVARMHPDYLTYFNLAAGGPRGGAEWLIDSNLDWGQDLYRVADVAKRYGTEEEPIGLLYFGHVDPAVYGIRYRLVPATPVQGVIAVSVNFLKGYTYVAPSPDGQIVNIAGSRAQWLRGLTPVERLGSILVFDTRDAASR